MKSKKPSAADRLLGRDEEAEDEVFAEEANESYRAFAQLRQPKASAFMIEFRLASGDSRALGYSWLVEAKHNPSTGIELVYTNTKVTLRGRHLRSLFVGITRHLVFRIHEAEPALAVALPADAPVVESIRIASP